MPKDVTNKTIKVGDYIVYATTSGRSPVLKFGKIAEIIEESILAKTVNHSSWDNKWEIQKDGRPVPLSFPNRMIVIPVESIPKPALKLLDRK